MSTTHGRAHAAQGRWLVFGAAALWGTSATLARFVFHERQVSPFVVVELRLTFAVAVLGPLLYFARRDALRVRREDWGYIVTLALCGVATVQGSYYYTISRLGVGLAILLQYLAPAIIVAWGVLRGRPASIRTVASVAAAVAGTALLVRGIHPAAAGSRPLDWAVGFASAFFFAFYVVFSKRGLGRYRPETVLFWTFAIAGLFWACVTPPWRILAAHYDPSLWLMFFTLGMFSTLVPFTLFYRGLDRMPAAEASVVATLEPVVALLSAWLFLGEALTLRQWFGAALVLAASLLATARDPARLPTPVDRA
ncbi:MAG: EamA family transporter [Candidatus Eisenbacteria bacterium]